MPEFLDYDEFTGLRYSTDFDEMTGRMTVITEQDVEPLLDWNKKLANEGVCDQGIKGEFFWWATIPNVVKLKLKAEYGLDVYSADTSMQKRVRQVIERDFPYCKTTYLKHV